jgi:hypothetical protein
MDVVADVGAADRIGAGEELLQRGGVVLAQPADDLCMGDSRHYDDSGLHIDVALA